MNQLFVYSMPLLSSFKIEWYWILIIILGVIITLITLYFVFKKNRYKKAAKKNKKLIDKNIGPSSFSNDELITSLYQDKKYKGTFQSFSSKNKKKAKDFLLKWLEYVPLEFCLENQIEEGKNTNIYIYYTKNQQYILKGKKHSFFNNNSLKPKENFKRLRRVMNKYKAARATIELICQIYRYEKHREDYNERPVMFENNYYIKYIIKK